MKLISLKFKNYRSYEDEYSIDFDEQFTSFIGKNDIGKSTILEALDIFFGNSKPDLADLCINSTDMSIEISCIFNDIPESLQIDSGAETNLAEEYLLNQDGNLEIKKVYKCTDKTIASSPELYIVANYPSNSNVDFLHSLNQSALKALGESKGVTVSDARMNHLWRKAIWKNIPDLKLELTNLKIEEFESKAKKIYSKIEDFIPLFFAFRADRQMTDTDAEAKDPMQLAVAEALEVYQSEIDSIKEKVQERVNSVAKLALEKLKEVDPNLANQLNPVLKSKPVWKFDYKIEDDRGIALNKRGSGTRRLVLFNFFRAQAEKKSLEFHKGIIYAIEEPETSQHPDNQKMIIDALINLTQDKNRQVVITTHSPELLKEIKDQYTNGIRFIQKNSSGLREIESGNDALILSANALGILSNQMLGSTKKIVLVEGKNDCLFLEHTASVMKESLEITKDFSDAKVELLPVGGCPGIRDWIRLRKHSNLGLKTYVFFDSDRISASNSPTDNEEFINSLSSDSTIEKAFCTRKREIENYIDQSLTDCKYGDFDDVKDIVSSKNSVPKNKILGKYWVQMKAENIDQEIKNIVRKIIET